MPRPLKPITPGRGPVSHFARQLRALRDSAGPHAMPIASISSLWDIPRSTLFAALGGDRVPSETVVVALARAWGGEVSVWLAWRRVAEQRGALFRDGLLVSVEVIGSGDFHHDDHVFGCAACGEEIHRALAGTPEAASMERLFIHRCAPPPTDPIGQS